MGEGGVGNALDGDGAFNRVPLSEVDVGVVVVGKAACLKDATPAVVGEEDVRPDLPGPVR